jgi:hypothetical protein
MRNFFIACLIAAAALRPAQAQNDPKSVSLETLGVLSGMVMYNTYLTIGGIADGYEYEVYESEYVVQLMDEQISAMNNVILQFDELRQSGFVEDRADLDFIENIQEALNLLASEAQALKAYADTGEQEDVETFQDYRRRAWDKISGLLGIESDED